MTIKNEQRIKFHQVLTNHQLDNRRKDVTILQLNFRQKMQSSLCALSCGCRSPSCGNDVFRNY